MTLDPAAVPDGWQAVRLGDVSARKSYGGTTHVEGERTLLGRTMSLAVCANHRH